MVGLAVFTAGVALVTQYLACPWYLFAIGGYGPPWPPGYLIGDAIVVGAGTLIAALWVGVLRTMERSARTARSPLGPWG